MSVHVSSWVWHHAKCDGNELIALLALADMANDDGECWPSISTLATRCRCDSRTVQKNLRDAQERGDLEVIARDSGNGLRTSNLYRFRKYHPWQNATPGKMPPVNVAPPKSSETLESSLREPSEASVRSSDILSEHQKNSHGVFSEEQKKRKLKLSLDLILGAVQPDLTLQSPAFFSAWQAWIKNRLQLRDPTLESFERHMMICKRLGEAKAISAINHSIASCYLSIYEPKQNQKTNDRDRIGASL